MPRAELFLGNLSRDVNQRDIEDVFEKYGKIIRCEVKNKGYGAAYAFLEYEDERDAEVYIY
jgi:RNA recognition motif-containing protein